ncbi:hypothetical protein NO113_19670, partial [Clostridioides difficile]|nr:hypothetical protein [Clostridioides difficile]
MFFAGCRAAVRAPDGQDRPRVFRFNSQASDCAAALDMWLVALRFDGSLERFCAPELTRRN